MSNGNRGGERDIYRKRDGENLHKFVCLLAGEGESPLAVLSEDAVLTEFGWTRPVERHRFRWTIPPAAHRLYY